VRPSISPSPSLLLSLCLSRTSRTIPLRGASRTAFSPSRGDDVAVNGSRTSPLTTRDRHARRANRVTSSRIREPHTRNIHTRTRAHLLSCARARTHLQLSIAVSRHDVPHREVPTADTARLRRRPCETNEMVDRHARLERLFKKKKSREISRNFKEFSREFLEKFRDFSPKIPR